MVIGREPVSYTHLHFCSRDREDYASRFAVRPSLVEDRAHYPRLLPSGGDDEDDRLLVGDRDVYKRQLPPR